MYIYFIQYVWFVDHIPYSLPFLLSFEGGVKGGESEDFGCNFFIIGVCLFI